MNTAPTAPDQLLATRFYVAALGLTRDPYLMTGVDNTSSSANGAACATVAVGNAQTLSFRETAAELPACDGHHLQIYVADFSGPHRRLSELGHVSEESDQHQHRFLDITDPQSGTPCFRLEHEVRSMTHPLYKRPLVNRNPQQSNRGYRPGADALLP